MRLAKVQRTHKLRLDWSPSLSNGTVKSAEDGHYRKKRTKERLETRNTLCPHNRPRESWQLYHYFPGTWEVSPHCAGFGANAAKADRARRRAVQASVPETWQPGDRAAPIN